MAKKIPPIAGFWLCCPECSYPENNVHDQCGQKYQSVYYTNGTLSNMKYIQGNRFMQWYSLTWTCFPWKEMRGIYPTNIFPKYNFIYCSNFNDLSIVIGKGKFSQAIHTKYQ